MVQCRINWENCTLQYLVDGMMEEVLELIGAMDATPTDDGPTNLYAVIEEAVDVANYCMMLADVAQAEIRREEGVKPVKVWAIELFPGASRLYVKSLKEAAEMLVDETLGDCYEVGDEIKIKITVREMSQEEYDSLPEWDGP